MILLWFRFCVLPVAFGFGVFCFVVAGMVCFAGELWAVGFLGLV